MRDAGWAKVRGDLRAARGRVILMIIAITASLAAVGAVLGTYGIASRELERNYRDTHPASATLELPAGADAALAAAARARPGVTDAEARGAVLARVRVGPDRLRFLLFVVDDFRALRLNTFTPEAGAWPPPDGTILLERSAQPMLGVAIGGALTLELPHGGAHELRLSGLVHDPGLAPAWQERTGYGYVTRATLAGLGEPAILDELRVETAATDRAAIVATAREVAAWLAARGIAVHEIRVPPSSHHPHAGQMGGLLLLMAIFAGMGLVLAAVLVAATFAALLARQVREIGVLKAIGARTAQVARLYVAGAVVIAIVSTAIAVPLGLVGARAFASMIAGLLNFELASRHVPAWVLALQIGAGLTVPVVAAKLPVLRAARLTVRAALDDDGALAASKRVRARVRPGRGLKVALAVRNAFRRPARLALVLGLLAAGGAMFLTAKDVEAGWGRMVGAVYTTRAYDVELRLVDDQPAAAMRAQLAAVPGVRTVEAWGWSPAAFAEPGQVDVVRTYPDGGHGSFTIYGVPGGSKLVDFPQLAGTWLTGEAGTVVLNHNARAPAGGARPGDAVTISIDGHPTRLRVIGIVQEVGAAAAAYVDAQTFARATGAPDRARLYRIATDARDPDARIAVIRAIEERLASSGIAVAQGLPLAELKTAMGEHVVVLVRMLQAMALLFALVGAFGLASTMSASVIERGRELGVLRAIGARPRTVLGLVVGEGVVIGALSWLVALALALPLALVVGRVVGALSFGIPLPLSPSIGAAAAWLALVVVGAAVSSAIPAWQTSRRPVHDALARP